MTDRRRGKFEQFIRSIEEETPTVDHPTIFAVGGYNQDFTIISTGTVKNASWTSVPQENFSAVGMVLFWDIYVQPVSGTAQLFVDIKNPASGEYTAIYQTTAFNATGTVATLKKYLFYPGAVDDGSGFTAVDRIPIPHWWRVRVIHVAPLSWDYCIGYSYLDS